MQMSLLCPFFFFKTKTNAILVNSNNTFGMTSGRELFATQIRSKPCLSKKKKGSKPYSSLFQPHTNIQVYLMTVSFKIGDQD